MRTRQIDLETPDLEHAFVRDKRHSRFNVEQGLRYMDVPPMGD
ncbi:MAG: hypothetical protein AB1543_02970 [Candidatus Bipolaricaulota bacterium]